MFGQMQNDKILFIQRVYVYLSFVLFFIYIQRVCHFLTDKQ